MITSEVQRKLVKSPPELWAELSEETSLARHLAELGEIRITRVEPEQAVEWEAEHTTGSVRLEPSGWGTKVTLTVNRELTALEETADGEEEPSADDEPAAAETPVAVEEPAGEAEPAGEDETTGAEAPTTAEMGPLDEESSPPEPTPRFGFFARLFRRRPRESRVSEPAAQVVAEAPPPVEDEAAVAHLDGAPEEPADQLRAAEEVVAEEVRTVLTSVLDRLGAAHHRPFSRA